MIFIICLYKEKKLLLDKFVLTFYFIYNLCLELFYKCQNIHIFKRKKQQETPRIDNENLWQWCWEGGGGAGEEKIAGTEEKAPVVTKSVKQLYVKITFLSVSK